MKQVTIVAFCDGSHDDLVPSTVERTVQIDGSKPVVLDLCGECDKAILALLMLMENGAVVKAKAKVGDAPVKPKKQAAAKPQTEDVADRTCPECGRVAVNRTALGQHTRTQHGKGLKAYKDQPENTPVEIAAAV